MLRHLSPISQVAAAEDPGQLLRHERIVIRDLATALEKMDLPQESGQSGFAHHHRWYQWFFRTSPERSLYYLVGNWAVMWAGLPAIVYCAWRFWQSGGNLFAEGTVVVIYAANILQWLIIPQKSTCYYYYYPSAMVLGVAIALALAGSKMRTLFGIRTSTLLIAAAACVFLFCYPKMANLQAPYDCALGCWS